MKNIQTAPLYGIPAVLLGALLLIACGPSPRPEPPPERRTASHSADTTARPRARANSAPATKYRVGDWVEYRFTGSVPGKPVTMCEQVIKQTGNHLEIRVTLDRGAEQRAWVQVLTDTPANQRANKIDALYELRDGKRHLLANPKNRDIFRLYSWILVMPDGRASNMKKTTTNLTFAGKTYTCMVISGTNVVGGKPAAFSGSICPDFLWTKGPGRFYLTSPEKDLVRSEVAGAGRQPPAELRRAPRCNPKSIRSK